MKKSLRLPDGTTTHIWLKPGASVQTLKSLLQLQTGIPIPVQSLSISGMNLHDTDRVDACGTEITLEIRLPSTFPLRLTILRTCSVGVQISVLGPYLISEVKARISEAIGIDAANLRLFVDGKITTDNQTVSEVYRYGSVWELLQPGEFFVAVIASNGHRYKVAASPTDRVQSIVNRLRDLKAFECGDQMLCYQGAPVNKAITLQEMGIADSAVISCQNTEFWLWVVFLDIRRIQIRLHPSEPILPAVAHSLKEAVPRGVTNGTVLTTQTAPLDLGLPAGAIVECGDLLVRVRSWNVEKAEVVVLADTSVASLTRVLEQRLGRRCFKLMHDGNELRGSRTFRDYGFEGETTVEAVTPSDECIWVKSEREMAAVPVSHSLSQIEELYRSATGDDDSFDYFQYKGDTIRQFRDQSLPLSSGEMLTLCRRREHDETDLKHSQLENTSQSRIVLRSAQRLPFALPYTSSTLVSEVKESVLMDEECAVLVWKGTCLENEKCVCDYRIEAGEFVDICRKNELVVRVFGRYESIYITVQVDFKLEEIRRQVQEQVGESLILFYHGLLLDDQASLIDLRITTGSSLIAIPASAYSSVHPLQSSLPPTKFIALQRTNGGTHILYFHHSNTWQDLTEFLRQFLNTAVFFLVLNDRLMTSHRFSRVETGSIVQVFTAKEALFVRYCGGTGIPVLLSPGMTVRSAIGTLAARREVYCGLKKVNLDALAENECQSGVVECVGETEQVYSVKWADLETMFLSSPSARVSDLIEAVQTLECDSSLRPLVFISSVPRNRDCFIPPGYAITFLEPPLLYIRVIKQQWTEGTAHLKHSDTVGMLRAKIAAEVRREHVRLLYEGKLLLDDSMTLESVGMRVSATVTALGPEDLLAFVGSQCFFVYAVNGTLPVSAIESRILGSFGLKKRSAHLLLNGVLLKREDCLKSYTKANIVTLELFKSLETLLLIRSPNGKQIHKIVSAKKASLPLLHSLLSSPARLYWAGEVNALRTLRDYGVLTSLFLIKRVAESKKIALFIIYHRTKFWRIKVERTASIATVKMMFKGQFSYNKTTHLLIRGEIADPAKALCEYDVIDGEFAEAIAGDSDFVRVVYAQQILTFPASATTTVGEVKAHISNRISVPERMQLVYCAGQLLADSVLVRELDADIELKLTCVCVHSWAGVVAVPSTKATTVVGFKQTLAAMVKNPAENLRLYRNGQELSDSQITIMSEIGTESSLTVLAPGEVLVCVKSAFENHYICAKETDTFRTIAKKLQWAMRIHYSRFQLIAETEVNSDRIAEAVCSSRTAVLTDLSDQTPH